MEYDLRHIKTTRAKALYVLVATGYGPLLNDKAIGDFWECAGGLRNRVEIRYRDEHILLFYVPKYRHEEIAKGVRQHLEREYSF